MAHTSSTHDDRERHAHERWIRAGLADLTGPEHGPALGPPHGFMAQLDALTDRIAVASAVVGTPVTIDGPETLAVRARMLGLRRRGRISCGGACHLVRAADGWFAVSLGRPEDWELLAAWIGLAGVEPDRWPPVHERCRDLAVRDVVARGALLGLPIGALPPPGPTRPAARSADAPGRPAPAARPGSREGSRGREVRVADLSSLWAGPLCGSVLAAVGAHVLKVESVSRPDGARAGAPAFFDLLNGAKEDVRVDLGTADGVRALDELLRSVDVVIESARPRALQQLGIRGEQLLAEPDGPRVWVSITGHGRAGDGANRVAFGDDAAVAGGLVAWHDGEPTFCADAVADPLTGLSAAALALEALAADRQVHLDVAMSRVAARFAGTEDR